MRGPLPAQVTSASAFLTAAIALLPHSSYAWGVALLVLITLVTAPKWLRDPYVPPGTWALVLAIGVMGLVWLYGSDFSKGASAFNKPSRYLFALPCLFCLLSYPPRRQWLLGGIACGAAVGGAYALYATSGSGQPRPWVALHQSSNAIQLGSMSALFGLICWIALTVYWKRWEKGHVAILFACASLGLLGSLLSQTRGAWLAVVLCTPILLWLIARCVSPARALACLGVLAAALLLLGSFLGDTVVHRVEMAAQEAHEYTETGLAGTSVGQRLEHWRVAWNMALEKPVAGWGVAEYAREKERRVAAGEAAPHILDYGHAHQELLDQFVKRGLIGVVGLLLFYVIPLTLFWPRANALRQLSAREREDVVCMRLIGVSIPLMFFGFGLTQVFFAHYNGVILYLVLIMFVFSILNGRGAAAGAALHAHAQGRQPPTVQT